MPGPRAILVLWKKKKKTQQNSYRNSLCFCPMAHLPRGVFRSEWHVFSVLWRYSRQRTGSYEIFWIHPCCANSLPAQAYPQQQHHDSSDHLVGVGRVSLERNWKRAGGKEKVTCKILGMKELLAIVTSDTDPLNAWESLSLKTSSSCSAGGHWGNLNSWQWWIKS